MRKDFFVGVLAALALTQPALADKASNSLNVAFTNEIATLDNYQESGREGLNVARLLYDGLISKNYATDEFEPELAEAFEFVSDTEIEFKIRPGVKFHNGETLTADDVVYTLNLVSSPEYGARYSIAVDWIEEAVKVDDTTVRLRMKTPYPLALEMLAGNLPIYPQAYYEEAGPEGMAVRPVGTGPYRLRDMTQGVHFVLERFEDYYEGGQKSGATIDTIDIRVLPEVNTQYAELMTGALDWIWRVPQDDVARLESLSDIKVEPAPIMRFEYISFNPNVADSPVSDPLVRKAIYHAINREGIREALVGGGSTLTNAACNPLQFGCEQDVATYEYNPDKARELLSEAGYADGFSIPMVVTSVPTVNAEAIAADLARVGITVNLNVQQYASAVDMWRGNRVAMMHTNWGSYGVGDVGLSVGNFFGGAGDDVIKEPGLVGPLEEANSIVDFERRRELYAEALGTIADEAYWVPLWTYSINTAMNADLDLTMSPDEFVPFYSARWN